MKNRGICIALAAIALFLVNCLPSLAAPWGPGWHGGHAGVGVWIGPGWWGYPYYPNYPYPYYPYPYPYYAPPSAVPPQQPSDYIRPEEPDYWYFCQDPKGYYPYVTHCPKGWLKVVPSPSPSPEGMEE